MIVIYLVVFPRPEMRLLIMVASPCSFSMHGTKEAVSDNVRGRAATDRRGVADGGDADQTLTRMNAYGENELVTAATYRRREGNRRARATPAWKPNKPNRNDYSARPEKRQSNKQNRLTGSAKEDLGEIKCYRKPKGRP